MGLTLPKPPDRGQEIILTALSGIIDRSPVATEMALGGSEKLDLSVPHKVFFVGLRDAAERRILSSAVQTGWRYIILRGDSPLAAAELGAGAGAGGAADDDSLEFSQLNSGPYVGNTVAGVQLAASLDAVRNKDYEPRLLRIPALYIVALWLHAEDERNDLIIPLPPTRPELKPFDSYSEQQFAYVIQGAALRKLALDLDAPDGDRA